MFGICEGVCGFVCGWVWGLMKGYGACDGAQLPVAPSPRAIGLGGLPATTCSSWLSFGELCIILLAGLAPCQHMGLPALQLGVHVAELGWAGSVPPHIAPYWSAGNSLWRHRARLAQWCVAPACSAGTPHAGTEPVWSGPKAHTSGLGGAGSMLPRAAPGIRGVLL